MNKALKISIVVIATFLIGQNSKYILAYLFFGRDTWNALDHFTAVGILIAFQVALILLASFVMFGKSTFENLKMDHGIKSGFMIGLVCTASMFIGYAWMGDFTISSEMMVHTLFYAGFFEEFFYRGFCFGLLFYFAGWGFIPAAILPSVFFGIGHLYQAESFQESIGIFLFTALAGVGFAWFVVVWNSLWPVIFLHGFMDLAWEMFDVDTNVTGNLMVNIFRFTTLGIMIYLSLQHLKKYPQHKIQGKLWINRT